MNTANGVFVVRKGDKAYVGLVKPDSPMLGYTHEACRMLRDGGTFAFHPTGPSAQSAQELYLALLPILMPNAAIRSAKKRAKVTALHERLLREYGNDTAILNALFTLYPPCTNYTPNVIPTGL